jgi:hypothetical protein
MELPVRPTDPMLTEAELRLKKAFAITKETVDSCLRPFWTRRSLPALGHRNWRTEALLDRLVALLETRPARPADGPPEPSLSEPFADFPRLQRKLLGALQGKPAVTLAAVTFAVYGHRDTATGTLEQLVVRTNRRLCEQGLRLEIKRKSNTLRLQPV